MWQILICLCLTFVAALSQQGGFDAFQFQQNDYEIIPEIGELVRQDERYMRASVVNFKYNRTRPAMNITLMALVDFGNDVQIIVQVYKFMSNEFRYFPLRFQINLCDALELNVIGAGNYRKCGNFTGCPIKKNKLFIICNWTIDQSKFPPLVPTGRYKVELEGVLHKVSLGEAHIIGRIERPVVVPKKQQIRTSGTHAVY